MYMLVSFFLGKEVNHAAHTLLYCVISEDLQGVGGVYISDCHVEETHPACDDQKLCKQIWERTEEILKEKGF